MLRTAADARGGSPHRAEPGGVDPAARGQPGHPRSAVVLQRTRSAQPHGVVADTGQLVREVLRLRLE